MADPYGSSESEDISSFLQILLQNSSSSVSTTDNSAYAAASGLFGGLEASNPRISFAEETDGINPSTIVQSSFLSCEDSEASEIPTNSAALRSSKRSRAAEDHNLSEKRRRSRINEKLKALQRLIPNSNKTDKASMLDEAIEYLKQLQLQVQMLTMRNGLSSNPGYSLGSSQPMLFPPTRLELDEANVFRDTSTLSRENDFYIQSNMENNINLIRSSTQPMLMPSTANNNSTSLRILPSILPSVQNHYDTVSQFQLDMNNSSPGVSSS